MKIEIKNRWNSEVIFAVEAESWKVAIELAIKSEADLSGANLSGANLSEADLSEADLSGANLSGANLSGADLSGADLSEADLSEADLRWADLSGANLSEADLSEADLRWANLRYIKHDIWGVLLLNKNEVPFLREAIINGKVNGSVYSGECSCLCGTLAKAKGIEKGDELSIADSSSMAERFFMGIKKGDTPENNPVSRLVLDWIDEFLELIK